MNLKLTKYCEPCLGYGWMKTAESERQCYRCGGTGLVLTTLSYWLILLGMVTGIGLVFYLLFLH